MKCKLITKFLSTKIFTPMGVSIGAEVLDLENLELYGNIPWVGVVCKLTRHLPTLQERGCRPRRGWPIRSLGVWPLWEGYYWQCNTAEPVTVPILYRPMPHPRQLLNNVCESRVLYTLKVDSPLDALVDPKFCIRVDADRTKESHGLLAKPAVLCAIGDRCRASSCHVANCISLDTPPAPSRLMRAHTN